MEAKQIIDQDSSLDEEVNSYEQEEDDEGNIVLSQKPDTTTQAKEIETTKPKQCVSEIDFEVICDKAKTEAMVIEKDQPLQEIKDKALLKLNYWKNYQKYGQVVEGTNIIPAKTFLMKPRWVKLLSPEDQFNIIDFMKEQEEAGRKIGAIVDINNSHNYYDFEICKKRYKAQLKNVEYRKVKLQFDALPTKSEMNKIYDILNKNAFKQHFVVLHCTHGNSRTGYAICYFLCKRFNIKVQDALDRFEKARGFKIRNQALVDNLFEIFENRVVREAILQKH